MSQRLDIAYRSQRLRLGSTVKAATASTWARNYRDRGRATAEVIRIVGAGQAQTVRLVDGYMAAKTRHAVGSSDVKGLNIKAYSIESLRKKPAEEIYGRPYGALAATLSADEGMGSAVAAGVANLTRLALTDLQLAQTHAARDWMTDSGDIVGYGRELGAGKNCELCIAASDQHYYIDELAPIHERCGCSVAPIFGDPGELTELNRMKVNTPSYTVTVAPDPELGARLLADGWAH